MGAQDGLEDYGDEMDDLQQQMAEMGDGRELGDMDGMEEDEGDEAELNEEESKSHLFIFPLIESQ